jgi:hypothetical protein
MCRYSTRIVLVQAPTSSPRSGEQQTISVGENGVHLRRQVLLYQPLNGTAPDAIPIQTTKIQAYSSNFGAW